MSIEIEIRNICRAALSCGIIGILPCCRGDLCRRIMPTVLVSGAGFIGGYTCKASLSASSWASTEWLSSSASARATAISGRALARGPTAEGGRGEASSCRRGLLSNHPRLPSCRLATAGASCWPMITRPHFRLNVFQKCRSHVPWGNRGT